MRTPKEIQLNIAQRIRKLRKSRKMTLEQFAKASGVSLGSIKRFERTGQISLQSLVKIAFALGREEELEQLFENVGIHSIEEIIHGEI